MSINDYFDLLQETKDAWETGDDGRVNDIRQSLVESLMERFDLSEADVAHLR